MKAFALLLAIVSMGFAGLFAYNGLSGFATAAVVEAFCILALAELATYQGTK